MMNVEDFHKIANEAIADKFGYFRDEEGVVDVVVEALYAALTDHIVEANKMVTDAQQQGWPEAKYPVGPPGAETHDKCIEAIGWNACRDTFLAEIARIDFVANKNASDFDRVMAAKKSGFDDGVKWQKAQQPALGVDRNKLADFLLKFPRNENFAMTGDMNKLSDAICAWLAQLPQQGRKE